MRYQHIHVPRFVKKITFKDVLFNGTYTIDPYQNCEFGCGYCDSSYDETVFIKSNAVERFKEELPMMNKGRIIIGSVHDAYQPIEEKVLPRELKIGFYTKDGEPLSDEAKMIFNSESPDARNREQKHRFVFKSNAKEYNNQNIYLRLLEKIEGTNQYRIYKEDVYTLLISFASEFDDF